MPLTTTTDPIRTVNSPQPTTTSRLERTTLIILTKIRTIPTGVSFITLRRIVQEMARFVRLSKIHVIAVVGFDLIALPSAITNIPSIGRLFMSVKRRGLC